MDPEIRASARETLARELKGLRWEAPVADRFRQSVRRRIAELDDAERAALERAFPVLERLA